MYKFTTPLIVSPRNDSKTWVIMEEFSFDASIEDKLETITVPVGFKTDFASVPFLLRGLIPRWGKHGKAAVIHDWLYWDQPVGLTREQADDIMDQGMRELEVNPLSRKAILRGVQIFGFIAWRKNADAKQAGESRMLTPEEFAEHGQSEQFRMASTIIKNVKATAAVVADKFRDKG